jgi:hypothetical protein
MIPNLSLSIPREVAVVIFWRALSVLVLLVGTGCNGSNSSPSLDDVRAANTRFRDVDAAKAAGYTLWSPDPFAPNATCLSDPAGKMGYHLVNVGLRGSADNPQGGDIVVEELKPEMLLYEKDRNGALQLVGVEYLVFTAAWEHEHGAGVAPPQVFGQPLLASSHAFGPGGPIIPHYELHVWLWKTNPLGMFAMWNPTVSC